MRKTLLFLCLSLVLSSCGWFSNKPEIAITLAEHFDNKLYNKFDTLAYYPIFSKKLDELSSSLSNPKTTTAFYIAGNNDPVLITRFFTNGQIDSLINYLQISRSDGLNPAAFKVTEIEALVKKLKANNFKNIDEVYPIIAELEIKTADALLRYTTFMNYGVVNPRNIFNRYYIKVKRPDSLMLDSVLKTKNMVLMLKNAQPTTEKYLDLKILLAYYRDSLQNENDISIQKIKLNMERLRWQMPIKTEEMVLVNIPDFSLTWFKKEDTLAHMNVCVGSKREATYADRMKIFLKTGSLDDKPKNHETPQLISTFNAIQVNPVWNIPVSIAQSEIYWMARRDPYYLSNSNIRVYYKGKQIYEPDTIQWNRYSRDQLPFTFKQGSGAGNALGKFKFVFDNSSSIYLHDTNNKNGFKLKNRAISHGCVRVENPLKFAELMVKDKYQYDQLRMEINLPPIDTNRNNQFQKILAKKNDSTKVFKLKPSWFGTRKDIAVVIGYYTAWAENGKVEFRPDVYEYDSILWDAISKYV